MWKVLNAMDIFKYTVFNSIIATNLSSGWRNDDDLCLSQLQNDVTNVLQQGHMSLQKVEMQTWGQTHLYLKVLKYFLKSICI